MQTWRKIAHPQRYDERGRGLATRRNQQTGFTFAGTRVPACKVCHGCPASLGSDQYSQYPRSPGRTNTLPRRAASCGHALQTIALCFAVKELCQDTGDSCLHWCAGSACSAATPSTSPFPLRAELWRRPRQSPLTGARRTPMRAACAKRWAPRLITDRRVSTRSISKQRRGSIQLDGLAARVFESMLAGLSDHQDPRAHPGHLRLTWITRGCGRSILRGWHPNFCAP